MEIWDLYDKDGKKTGEYWERHFGNNLGIPEGRYHLVCDILVRHRDGSYLLTQRDSRKDVYPGYWEASAGGSALKGETPIEGAKRELYEETGLQTEDFTLLNVSFKDSSKAMFYSYLAVVDGDKDAIRLQEGETVAYKWVDEKELLEYVHSEGAIKSHNLRYQAFFDELEHRQENDASGKKEDMAGK